MKQNWYGTTASRLFVVKRGCRGYEQKNMELLDGEHVQNDDGDLQKQRLPLMPSGRRR